MASNTRGLAQQRGIQLRNGLMRNRHFDENNKIDEKYIDIKWSQHRDILEDTKIDVFVQDNEKEVAGQATIDVTDAVGGRPVSNGVDSEGLVLDARVEVRIAGTDDFPTISPTGEKVYGRLREEGEQVLLDFFYVSGETGEETPYTFEEGSRNIDYRFVVRTNLAVLPVDAIVSGGGSFVEGATDAKAYMNLQQLMKDIYGAIGRLDGDGNPILEESIQDQINALKEGNEGIDQELRDDLASTEEGKGASIVGVVSNENYEGVTVQDVLVELASKVIALQTDLGEVEQRVTNAETVIEQLQENGVGGADVEQFEERLIKLEEGRDRSSFTVTEGGEHIVALPDGKKAMPKSLIITVNGSVQAPNENYTEIADPDDGGVVGVDIDPAVLETNDTVFIWWENMYLDVDTEGMEELVSIPVTYQVI